MANTEKIQFSHLIRVSPNHVPSRGRPSVVVNLSTNYNPCSRFSAASIEVLRWLLVNQGTAKSEPMSTQRMQCFTEDPAMFRQIEDVYTALLAGKPVDVALPSGQVLTNVVSITSIAVDPVDLSRRNHHDGMGKIEIEFYQYHAPTINVNEDEQMNIKDLPIEDIVTSINMRICIIETGDSSLRATDIEAAPGAFQSPGRAPAKIKALSREQRDLINRLEDAVTLLRAKS